MPLPKCLLSWSAHVKVPFSRESALFHKVFIFEKFFTTKKLWDGLLVLFSGNTGNIVCSIGNIVCNIGNIVCSIGNIVCNIGNIVCNIGNIVCNIGNIVCNIGNIVCNIGNIVCNIGNIVCNIRNIACKALVIQGITLPVCVSAKA